MAPTSRNNELEPNVGIFWLFEGRLTLDVSPLSQAESYGDCLGHPTSHDEYWTAQQCLGVVPRDMEYYECPRGRVVYNSKTKRFALYVDRCILKRKSIDKQIMKAMHLPAGQTDVMTDGPDGHYRCSSCMGASAASGDDAWD